VPTPTEFWRWWITDDLGRRHRTSYRMTREEALKRHPDAVPVPGTMEIRNLSETYEEQHSVGGLRKP
jgi:hypothetical protein